MTDRHTPGDRGRKAPSSAGHHAPHDAATPGAPVDPELDADLGPELEMRGDQLGAEIEAARTEAAEWRDKGMRAQAEFENVRKRLETRHADALLRAGERIIEALLPVIDDFDRAIDHAVADGSDVAEGLSAVQRKLLDVLKREGAVQIDPLGEEFDPARHNAVQMRDDAEVPDHTVVDVLQKGYEMHGRVLRPAMVVVSAGGPARK